MFKENREVLVSFVSLCPRGLLGQICSPGNTYFLTFKLSNHMAPPAIPLHYRVLPGRRFRLLCNDKVKVKGVAENLNKFELKPKSSPHPKVN